MRGFPWIVTALSLQGCFAGALEPWVMEADRVDAASAVGVWIQDQADPAELTITAGTAKRLVVVMKDKDHPAGIRFVVGVAKVGASRFADLQLDEDDVNVKPVKDYVVRPHWLLKVAQDGDVLKLWLVDRTWFRNAAKAGKIKIPMTGDPQGEDTVIFTAPSGTLKRGMIGLEKEAAAFAEPVVFKRKKG